MGVNKSITIEGATFQFEVKSKDGVMHVSLYSGEGEAAQTGCLGSGRVVHGLRCAPGNLWTLLNSR